ncbi:Carboxylesterase NlhH [Rubripirellula lacrimiformis]|uniref:Carboxylesterase NlhH n=1 Tax=Rubripirellula lacrimiformis TaxID=1930273 RepID=A0A517NL63_9BACT|nr:alpha/beta hydrolase [Rubripirellula lacrimiformis]QDT07876.1 Carboxylesterase NlhH [Rubripirellula lacrimiformis]
MRSGELIPSATADHRNHNQCSDNQCSDDRSCDDHNGRRRTISPLWLAIVWLMIGSQTSLATDETVSVVTDQRYGETEGKAGLCDVYSPTGDVPTGGFPAVVVIHGGGWMSGDKWTLGSYARQLAENGFVAITINYRLAPTHPFPAQADDVRQALLWTNDNAKRLSIDLDRLGVFGYSAGGHLSLLIASLADEPVPQQAAASQWSASDSRWKSLPKIRAVCAGGPPCDFRSLPIDNTALAYFLGGSRREKPQLYAAASPAAHVSATDPVTQIIHGVTDLIVPIQASQSFHDAQIAAAVDSRMTAVPQQGHMLTFLNPSTRQTMVRFFQEVMPADAAEPSVPAASE